MALEGILVNGVTEIINRLLPVINERIILAWGVKDDLRKLTTTLESIQALITDAEEKQAKDATVRLWLKRLKNVVYDADDVMDELSYETMRRREMGGDQIKHKVRNFVSSSNPLVFRFKMAGKIRAIKKSLDEIYDDKVRYTLNATSDKICDSHVSQTREQRNRLTASVVDDSMLIGRKDEKSDIVNLLTDKMLPLTSSSLSNCAQQEKLSVVSIVGMGGLGKTTLAQLVYKDDSIEKHFELKIWVCVSDNLDVYRILKEIIESITKSVCGDLSNVDMLATRVQEKLNGKKYLLVLDDLWNEDAADWEKLKGFLVNGVEGSKILVTTRNHKVASVVGGRIYNLQKLTNDECWSIIEKKVLSLGGAVLTPNMTKIGKEIAKKCDGLPLAANSLGSLLYSKRDESYWLLIRNDNNLWDTPENKRILSILKLSYDNLPSPLQQCFSYCCIFPKDSEIKRETLIRIWVAQGFLHTSNEVYNRSVEDIGNDYFELLLWNSFFQDIELDELGVIRSCKMHDFVHDLATSVVDRNEFAVMQSRDGNKDVSKVRYLQLLCGEGSSATFQKTLSEAKNLRTVVAIDPKKYSSEINIFFSNKRLRVLFPLGDWVTSVSSSVLKLKHLRYLDLSGCKIDLLHDVSVSRSYNLQTLVLRNCVNVSRLLGGIGSLKNLRHLDASDSDITLLPDSVVSLTNLQTLNLHGCRKFEGLPESVGLLNHLRFLDVSNSSIKKLPDSLSCINNLKTLQFKQCMDLNALPKELGALTQLRCLDLGGTGIKVLPESCISNLWNLEIVEFGACELPKDIKSWPKLKQLTLFRSGPHDHIMPRGIETLTRLETLRTYIVGKEANTCRSGIEELAPLNSLRVLWLVNLESVRGIEDARRAKLKNKQNMRDLRLLWKSNGEDANDEMVLEGLQPHPNLTDLRIVGYSGLKLPKWMEGSVSNCLLPNLDDLVLSVFKRCEYLPALGILPRLRILSIARMDSLKCLGKEFYYQQQEEEESSGAKKLSLFPLLYMLNITDMNLLEDWVAPPQYNCFPSLKWLSIRNCSRLRSIPINSFSSLKNLRLKGTNDRIVRLFLGPSKGEGLGGSLSSQLNTPSLLAQLTESPELIYFPLGVLAQLNTPSLLCLDIDNCSNFQGFCDDALNKNSSNNRNNNSISSLRSLNLSRCPVLTFLPDLQSWTSLRKLTIWKCDKLKESIPYDLKKTLIFLESLKVDFIQSDKQQGLPSYSWELLNLMSEEKK